MNTDLNGWVRCGLLCGGLLAAPAGAHGAGGGTTPGGGAQQRPQEPSLQTDQEKIHREPDPTSQGRQPAKEKQGQDDGAAGTDSRGSKSQRGGTTGSTGHGGMQGSGASSGSGGTPDMRN